MTDLTLADLRAMDATDPLAPMRDLFTLPEGVVYLDGNSLGALPRATPDRLARAVREEWGHDLIGSWNSADWIGAPQRIGAKIAALIGARDDEVVVADSTSANLFKLLVAGLGARPGRRVILSEPGNFPTDLYVAQGVTALLPGTQLRTVDRTAILDAIDDDVAIVMLTHVHYKSGARFHMAAITQAAHAKGALVLWDLSHSAGAVEIDLNGCDVDLAIGCGYKYLNGGPGAPAFLYVTQRLQQHLQSPMTGWMGHSAPFAFDDDYAPGSGISRFLCGTPPILGMAALEVGVDLMHGIDSAALYDKAQRLCDLFIALVEQECGGHDLTCITPPRADARGSHVSFRHDQGYAIMQALIARGVIGDFRAPDILRFGMTPLYVGYEDVWRAVQTLREVMDSGCWAEPAYQRRAAVT